jgi:hypothetical protein
MRLTGTGIRLLTLTSATRYDKHALIYLAAIVLNHRIRIC